eukprot:357951-Chlamydomonas_euryale.AAC.1
MANVHHNPAERIHTGTVEKAGPSCRVGCIRPYAAGVSLPAAVIRPHCASLQRAVIRAPCMPLAACTKANPEMARDHSKCIFRCGSSGRGAARSVAPRKLSKPPPARPSSGSA